MQLVACVAESVTELAVIRSTGCRGGLVTKDKMGPVFRYSSQPVNRKKKFSFFHRGANMHTVCMHVQFKNIKRSVPAIERIEPSFPSSATSSGNHNPGPYQQYADYVTLTNPHQLQILATITRNIQWKCEYNVNIVQEKTAIPTKAFRIYLAQREFLQKIYHSIHLPWISTLIDSGDKETVSYLRFE